MKASQVFACLLLVPALLLAVLFIRSELYFPREAVDDVCNVTHASISGDHIVQRFSKALTIQTITRGTQDYDGEPRLEFARFLAKSFPTIYSSPVVTVETVNNYSLLYGIKGSDSTLKPYLLCSHLDVVPVEADKWEVKPFSGSIKDGFIYGRGSIDVKNTLMAIMESLEYLLKGGFKPKRSFYIAFGHDEEGQGIDGAQEIAKVFKARGVTFEYLLDEGMMIFKDQFYGVKDDVAVVGVSEKGFLTVKVKATGTVGHSSMPETNTAITRLARAVAKLTGDAHPNLFGLGPERTMIESFARHASYPAKLVYSNLWLFSPILSRVFASRPSTNALVRTTSAVTIINGGVKDNILPSGAEAVVNHRIHPMQSVREVFAYDMALIGDEQVQVEVKGDSNEPHPLSPYDSDAFGYQTISRSLRQVFAETIVIPGVLVATTDTRWYLPITKAVYRFSPSVLTEKDMGRFHGNNERISVDNYMKTVNFYHHIMLNSDHSELAGGRPTKDEL